MILKLECLFYQNIYLLLHLFLLYFRRAVSTQVYAKKPPIEKTLISHFLYRVIQVLRAFLHRTLIPGINYTGGREKDFKVKKKLKRRFQSPFHDLLSK